MEQANQEIQRVNNQPEPEAELLNMPQENPIHFVHGERSVDQSSSNENNASLLESPEAGGSSDGAGQSTTNNVRVSSSSDECEFVQEQRPQRQRTPERYNLSSDTDSDVPLEGEYRANNASQSWVSSSSPRIGWEHPTPPVVHQNHSAGEVINIYVTNLSSDSNSDDSFGDGRRNYRKKSFNRFVENTAGSTKRRLARVTLGGETAGPSNQVPYENSSDDSD